MYSHYTLYGIYTLTILILLSLLMLLLLLLKDLVFIFALRRKTTTMNQCRASLYPYREYHTNHLNIGHHTITIHTYIRTDIRIYWQSTPANGILGWVHDGFLDRILYLTLSGELVTRVFEGVRLVSDDIAMGVAKCQFNTTKLLPGQLVNPVLCCFI